MQGENLGKYFGEKDGRIGDTEQKLPNKDKTKQDLDEISSIYNSHNTGKKQMEKLDESVK